MNIFGGHLITRDSYCNLKCRCYVHSQHLHKLTLKLEFFDWKFRKLNTRGDIVLADSGFMDIYARNIEIINMGERDTTEVDWVFDSYEDGPDFIRIDNDEENKVRSLTFEFTANRNFSKEELHHILIKIPISLYADDVYDYGYIKFDTVIEKGAILTNDGYTDDENLLAVYSAQLKPFAKVKVRETWMALEDSTPILTQFKEKLDETTTINRYKVWNGEIAHALPDSYQGTESDPIRISTAEQLAKVVKDGGNGKHYKLTKDIYLNDIFVDTWYDSENNNAWFSYPGIDKEDKNQYFKGVIDGDGHIIYGLWYPTTQTGNVGLIPQMNINDYLVIKNLGIRNARIYSEGNAGGFLGHSIAQYGITFENCFVDETVNVHGGNRAAGFVANLERSGSQVKLDILNCYTKAIVDNVNDNSCGFLGQGYNATFTIKNSYCYGERIYHSTSSNRNTLSTEEAPFANLYTTNQGLSWAKGVGELVEAGGMVGKNAEINMPGLDYENIWVIINGQTPILRLFEEKLTNNVGLWEEEGSLWNGEVAEYFFYDRAGTKSDPILIRDGAELAKAVKEGGLGKHYKLVKDIYLNNVRDDWGNFNDNWAETASNTWDFDTMFNGTIDGDGHIIYGLYAQSNNNLGLVAKASRNGAHFKNLGIRYANLTNTSSSNGVGAFVGFIKEPNGKATFDQCFVDETVIISGYYAGGFVGCMARQDEKAYVYIDNCYSFAQVKGSKKGNIFISSDNGKWQISNSYTIGQVGNTSGNDDTYVSKLSPAYINCYGTSNPSDKDLVVDNTWNVLTQEEMTGVNALTKMGFVNIDDWMDCRIYYKIDEHGWKEIYEAEFITPSLQ